MPVCHQQRVVPVLGLQHQVPLAHQEPPGDRAYAVVVLDEQDRLRPAARRLVRLRLRLGLAVGRRCGKVDVDSGALARRARQVDLAAAVLHDPEHRGQPQAGALAPRLGGEERFEDVGLDRLVHADTGVADAEHDVVARGHVHQPAGVVAVEARVGRLDGEHATVGHRVTGVRGEIEDDLLDETVVGPDRYHVPGQPPGQLDVLADQPLEHGLHVRHGLVEVEPARMQDLLVGEGQQLVGQVGGAPAGVADVLDLGPPRIAGGEHPQQRLAVAVDDGEQVVEVVRDATGEPADRLHLLRVPQLCLQAGLTLLGPLTFGHLLGEDPVGGSQFGGTLGHPVFEFGVRAFEPAAPVLHGGEGPPFPLHEQHAPQRAAHLLLHRLVEPAQPRAQLEQDKAELPLDHDQR